MAKLNNFLFYFLLILSLIFFGYLRDYLFVNINFQLAKLYYKDYIYTLPENLSFLQIFSYNQLFYGKWILTIVFMLIYFLITCAFIKKIFTEKKYIKWTAYSFLTILFISFLFYSYGILFHDYDNGYTLSRVFMGMVQSPLVLMILIPAFKLSTSSLR